MYAQCLLIAALIFSAWGHSPYEQRNPAPTSVVAIVERMRSELARRVDPRLTRVDSAPLADTEPGVARDSALHSAGMTPAGLYSTTSTMRLGSGCWWLWLLSGLELCG